jgi:tetratricopeptide (TPR) repeat protein
LPTLTFISALFSAVFSVAFAAGVVWLLEKKAGHARKEVPPLAFTFMAGAFSFTLLYFLNRYFFPRGPWAAALANISLLAGLLLYPELKRRAARLKKEKFRMPAKIPKPKLYRLEGEINALRAMLARDPQNAFCHERLSEIYELEEDYAQSLEEARAALKLEPTERNRLRLEDLGHTIHLKLHGRKRRFWARFTGEGD